MKVLVTCPPMLGMLEELQPEFDAAGLKPFGANVIQTLSEDELMSLLPEFDGWIIGDDPASRRVFEAGKTGKLKAAVKWGIGVDNVDFQACKDLGIPITNTPNMFGAEVADVALGYVVALARDTFFIDREIRAGRWSKPAGISLAGRNLSLLGFGDIGKQAAARFVSCGLDVTAYDPVYGETNQFDPIRLRSWPDGLNEADFLVITCSLNESTKHLVNANTFKLCKPGLRLVNVGRGPIVHETSLVDALRSGSVHSAALDVFEVEPLPANSYLREHPRCILGSHNSSNTVDAVIRASLEAISCLRRFLYA